MNECVLGSWVGIRQGVGTGAGHEGIRCVLQTQFSSLFIYLLFCFLLQVYETTKFYGRFCPNGIMPFIQQSVSCILNLRFVTEVYNTRFDATYYQVTPMRGSSGKK